MKITKLDLVFTVSEIKEWLLDVAADIIHDEVVNGFKRDKLKEMLESGSILDHILVPKGFISLNDSQIVDLYKIWGYSHVEQAVEKLGAKQNDTEVHIFIDLGENVSVECVDFRNIPNKI